MTIDKQAVQAVADLKAGYTLGHADVEIIQQMALDAVTLLDELEAAEKQNAQDVQIKARLCRESNSLHDRLRAAEQRIAELEATLSNKLPGGFSLDDAKELHTNLVNSHISKAISGERMKLATRNTDLAWIKTQLVSAAWFVQASIEAHSAAGISIKGSE